MMNQWKQRLAEGKGVTLCLMDGSRLYIVPMSIFRKGRKALMATAEKGGTLIMARKKKVSLVTLVRCGFSSMDLAVQVFDLLTEILKDDRFMVRQRGVTPMNLIPFAPLSDSPPRLLGNG